MVPSPPEVDSDPDLARLKTTWPSLPAHIKSAILALLDAGGGTAPTSATDAPRAPVSRSSAEDGQDYQGGEEGPRDERGQRR